MPFFSGEELLVSGRLAEARIRTVLMAMVDFVVFLSHILAQNSCNVIIKYVQCTWNRVYTYKSVRSWHV